MLREHDSGKRGNGKCSSSARAVEIEVALVVKKVWEL
jgi:hypothetical protein